MLQEFENTYHIFVPQNPILSVVDGAARLGKIANFVKSRVVDKTYGVSCAIHIMEAKSLGISEEHINQNKFLNNSDGEEYVNNCFDIFVSKKEEVQVDQMREFSFGRAKDEWWDEVSEHLDTTYIYASDDPKPVVTAGLVPLAKIELLLPSDFHANGHKLSNRMYFGNTTLKVTTILTMSDGTVTEREVQVNYDYSIEKKK